MAPTRARIIHATEMLGVLSMFPSSEVAQHEIMRLMERMVNTKEELDNFVRVMIDRVGIWEGPTEFRARFCSLYYPADGVVARSGKDSDGKIRHPELEPVANPMPEQANPECAICSGTGWATVFRGGLSGAQRCSCWAKRPVLSEAAELRLLTAGCEALPAAEIQESQELRDDFIRLCNQLSERCRTTAALEKLPYVQRMWLKRAATK